MTAPHVWKEEEDARLCSLYRSCTIVEIAEMLGLSYYQVKRRLHFLGIKARHPGRKFTAEQEEWLVAHNHMSASEMSKGINDEFSLSTSPDEIKGWRARTKNPRPTPSRFQKGHTPFSKGKKWDEYMSPESQARSRMTTFKKGDTPHNTQPLGSISIMVGYWVMKVSHTGNQHQKWKFLHRLLWEKEKGPIPKGMNVVFRNGDRNDIRMENLMLMDRKEMARYTPVDDSEPEMQRFSEIVARVAAKVAEKMKGEEDEKQDE